MTSEPLIHEPATDGMPPRDGGIEVSVPRGPLIGLLLLNTLLNIVTLGFYRFWARTKVRQRLWTGVSLQGEAFAYTGTGKELFIGFLVALVALLPFTGIVALINSLVPPTEIFLNVLVQIAIALSVGMLGIVALYFARRYLLTRTRWRGIHGSQDRVLGAYIAQHLVVYARLALTAGLVLPWADARLYNYRTGIVWFGTEKFSAQAEHRPLWLLWVPTWFLLIVGYISLIIVMMPFLDWSAQVQAAQAAGEPPPGPPQDIPVMAWLLPAGLLMLASALYFLYTVRRILSFLGATRLGDMRFELTVGFRELIYIPVVGVLIYVVALGLGFGSFALLQWLGGPQSLWMLLAPLLSIFVILAGISILSIAWTQVEVLRLIGRHLRLHNIGVLDGLLNRGQPAPTRGEGLADAIGDIGIGA
ncbi:DUF898 family protein [Niveispirillum sp. KHB5.9]|uniref:DUF898 family protein n=1 Tax=Niveispirillum sp. KHB5.9 TaxID=3400269 RepID=UPI003A89C6CA